MPPGRHRQQIKNKEGGGSWFGVIEDWLVVVVIDRSQGLCYWDVASSSWAGFKSTTVIPFSEGPPIPSVANDDDGAMGFLLAPPKGKKEGWVRLLGAETSEGSSSINIADSLQYNQIVRYKTFWLMLDTITKR